MPAALRNLAWLVDEAPGVGGLRERAQGGLCGQTRR